jgi:hypothetical protein
METEPELPAPNPISFGFDMASNSPSFVQAIPFVHGQARQPRALLARGRDSLPPVSKPVSMPVSAWPRGFEVVPDVRSASGRPQLPAPSLQSLGYSSDIPKLWVARKAPIDVVAEARGAVAVNEIQRLLESLPEETATPIDNRNRTIPQLLDPEDGPGGSTSPLRLRGPTANAVMPRGAFP